VRIDTLELEPDTLLTIYLEGVDFPLHLVKQVFINADNSIGILYLVTSGSLDVRIGKILGVK